MIYGISIYYLIILFCFPVQLIHNREMRRTNNLVFPDEYVDSVQFSSSSVECSADANYNQCCFYVALNFIWIFSSRVPITFAVQLCSRNVIAQSTLGSWFRIPLQAWMHVRVSSLSLLWPCSRADLSPKECYQPPLKYISLMKNRPEGLRRNIEAEVVQGWHLVSSF